ncbi:MAG: carbohydrate kinase family protein [Anaerolineae bacterium]|nr:MAG: carbohydrate kinase family protein [Anaerolineae bacterium]
MANILVSGLINIETTVEVEEFPIPYSPVEYNFFGVDATVSGVGYNVSKALTRLGDRVSFLSIIGQDLAVASVRAEFAANYLSDEHVLDIAAQTARSIIFFDKEGRRKILVDLKDMQEQRYPMDVFERTIVNANLAVLCNINFSRPMLKPAKAMGKLIATDVHTLSDVESEYDREFMEAADILFMSHELLPAPPPEFANEMMRRYKPRALVISLGKAGALMRLRDDGDTYQYPAVDVRPVVNTIGAGDSLFSAFVHGYAAHLSPQEALKRALVFAAYKIGVRSASEGFLSSQRLEELYSQYGGG